MFGCQPAFKSSTYMLVDPFLSPILTVASVLNNGETGDIHITYFKKTVWAGGCKSDFDDCLQQKIPM